MDTWRQRLVDRIEELGLTRAEVSRRAGVKPTMLTDILVRNNTPSVHNLFKIAQALNLSLSELYEGRLAQIVTLTVNGVHDGDTVRNLGENGENERVSISLPRESVETLKIATDRYEAAGYRRGDVVAGVRTSGAHAHNLIGKDVIAQLANGRRVLGQLQSPSAGRLSLRFFHRSEQDIQDVDLSWAAPITLIFRE